MPRRAVRSASSAEGASGAESAPQPATQPTGTAAPVKRRASARVRRRRLLVLLIGVPLLILAGWGVALGANALFGPSDDEAESPSAAASGEPQTNEESEPDGAANTESQAPSPSATPTPEPEPERASDASSDPDSIHVLANRHNPLQPADYEPDDLVYPNVVQSGPEDAMMMREEAAAALEDLFVAAEQEASALGLVSGYRSFDYQVQIYSQRHAEVGTEETDLYMSRPGYSEHQTGLTADVVGSANPDCILGTCFADTEEGQWVADNAHRFGFVVRYLEDMEDITGYPYEPWHLRYVGEETAEEVYEEGLTMEEYWEVDPAPDYDEPEPNPEHLLY